MRIFFCFLIISILLSCQNSQKKNPADIPLSDYLYSPDSSWPQLPKDFVLSQPTGIGIDTSDHIFVFHRAGRKWVNPFPDSTISMPTILELDNKTGKIIHAWGEDYFIMPHGLTVDKQNNIWVTDVGLHQVFKFSHDGKLLLTLGTPKVPGNDSLHFNLPTDVAVADNGSFYVSDGYGNSRIVKFSASGKFIKAWGTYGNQPGSFIIPHGIAIDSKQTLYVADRQNNRIQLFDTTGRFIKEIKNDMQVQQLPSLTIDRNDRLFAIDYDPTKKKNSTVTGSTIFIMDSLLHPGHHFGANGTLPRTTCWFHDIAVDSKGNLYVGDIVGLKLQKFNRQ